MNTSSNDQAMTMAGLNLIQQALSIYDSDLRLVVSNARFRQMFALPDWIVSPGADFAATIRYLAERGEYGAIDDIDAFVQERVALARAFEPHYIERQMGNGRWISVEGSPLPNGGWVAVYTDITGTKRQEELLRTRSETLSDQLLTRAEELASTNRELEATITALEEAKRQLTAMEARTRLTTEMMPAHIAHVSSDQVYTFSNRRVSSVMPGSLADPVGHHAAEVLGPQPYSVIAPHLERGFAGKPSVFEFTHEPSSRRIRVALTPDASTGGSIFSRWTSPKRPRPAPHSSKPAAANWPPRWCPGWPMIFPTCLQLCLAHRAGFKTLVLNRRHRTLSAQHSRPRAAAVICSTGLPI